MIRAAGGVLVRGDKHHREVAVVHRPRYDDWSFPKGKLAIGETDEEAALREVLEETGIEAKILRELPNVEYAHRTGEAKVVRYWLMAEASGAFISNAEVDELRWLSPEKARSLLTYPRDRAVLDAALDAAGP